MPECRRLILNLHRHLLDLLAICLALVISIANPCPVIAAPFPDGSTLGAPGRPLSGRVLAASDAKPLAGVRLILAGQSATTDANGSFLFAQPPSGYQLVKIDHVSIEPHRKRLKDGSLGGHMHTDPVLVNVSSEKDNELLDPIYVVQTHPTMYAIAPGAKADIRPTHIPGLKLSIPEGTTIKAEDGQPQSQVSITPVRPDRCPAFRTRRRRARSIW